MNTSFSEDGKTIKFRFVEGKNKHGSEAVFGKPPYKDSGKYTLKEYDNLVEAYRQNLASGLSKITAANADGLTLNESKKILKTLTRAEAVALRMHSRGFINVKMSEVKKTKNL